MEPEDIAKCQFVPFSAIQKTMEFLETTHEYYHDNCKRNLLKMQKNAIFGAVNRRLGLLKDNFNIGLYRAINAHDWNKLLYLLKKSPIWQQAFFSLRGRRHYIRAVAILMMYHPSAQSQNMLREYFHMVCSCRTDEEKRALMRLILELPEKILEQPRLYMYQRRRQRQRQQQQQQLNN